MAIYAIDTSIEALQQRLVIISDQPGTAKSLKQELSQEGYSAYDTHSYQEALQKIKQDEINIAIFDWDSANTKNIKSLAMLKRDCPHPLQVIIYTAESSLETATSAINLGAFAYVEKNNSNEELIHHINRASYDILLRQKQILEQTVQERTRQLYISQRQAQVTLDSIGDGVVAIDSDNKIAYMNPIAEQMTGALLTDAYKKPLEKIFDLRDTENLNPITLDIVQKIRQDVANLSPRSLQSHYGVLLNKQGIEYKVAIRGASIKEEIDSGSVLVLRDVTHKHRIEKELRESKTRLKAILDNSSAMIYLKDRNGRFLLVNKQCERVLGKKNHELVGSLSYDHYTQNAAATQLEADLRTLQSNQPIETEHRTLINNQEHIYLTTRCRICDDQGRPYAICGIGTDITERKRSEQVIREREKKYRALVDTTDTGYTIFDGRGRIIDANAEFIRFTGCKNINEVIGREIFQWIAPYELEKQREIGSIFRKKGKITGREIDFIDKEGNIIAIEFSATAIQDNNEIRVLAIGRDIGDRRKAEKEKEEIQSQLRQAQKMEAIGQLTGGIAHDFNNILASIMGYTELSQQLCDQVKSLDNSIPLNLIQKLESYLTAVYSSGERARDLVQKMMTFSRGGDISVRVMKIEPAINEIVSLLSSTLPKTIVVKTEYEDKLPLVLLDPVQLHQIVMNLCINARDAMEEKGIIRILVRHSSQHLSNCSSCHGNIEGEYVEIIVKDNGPGIDEKFKDRIFEPFFTTKNVGQGTGMGLSMVHGIVHEHGGHIILRTAAKRGTEIKLLFPISNEEVSVTPEKPLALEQDCFHHGHILIVEDEEMLANFMTDLFQSHGYQVTVYTHSARAKEDFANIAADIDLVVTDQTMPEVTGSELAKHILQIKPGLPIVLCTGFSFSIDEKSAYELGITRFLQKPLNSQQLLKEVRALISPANRDPMLFD